MSQNSKLLRALRRIADTSRKFNRKHSTATPNVPTVLRSLPEHKPLLPLLLSHDIPLKLAKACADRYDRYANQLRSETETQLVPYLVNHRKNVPIRVYLLFFSNYTHALRDWAQSTLNAALKCLKRQPVELTDWDAASSPPLWIPPHPTTRESVPEEESIFLSPVSAPPHAFPTTYPPPLRPQCELSVIEWPRTPTTVPSSPSTSTIDIDSLCKRFSKLLVIDENPTQPLKPKASIFSLPASSMEASYTGDPHTTRSKRKSYQDRTPKNQPSIKPDSTTCPRVAKPRRRSLPPSFPPPLQKIRPASRKASVPATPCSPQRATPISTFSGPPWPVPPKDLPPALSASSPFDGLDAASCLELVSPQSINLQPDSSPGLNVFTLQHRPASPTGPTTPPTVPSELFSEPAVVSLNPTQLTPGLFSPIVDPFVRWDQNHGYFLDVPFQSPFGYSGSILGLALDDCSSKSTFDSPLVSRSTFPGLVTPIQPATFMCNSLTA